MKLKNLNALITGGSQGLGKVIAEHFLREGANVVLCARSEKDLFAARTELAQKFPTQKIFSKTCDVANESQVNELVAFARRELGDFRRQRTFECFQAITVHAVAALFIVVHGGPRSFLCARQRGARLPCLTP